MRIVNRLFVFVFLISLLTVTVFTWLSFRCSGAASCRDALLGDVYNWQALIGASLVFAGVLLLMAPSGKIETQKDMTEPRAAIEDQSRLRAARMRLAYQLELLAETYDKIIGTIEEVTRELTRPAYLGLRSSPASSLPLPQFATDMSDLVLLPPSEGEALLGLCRDISRVNAFVERLPHNTDQALLEQMVRLRAAKTVVLAIYWRNQIGSEIGWQNVTYPAKRIAELQSILAETKAAKTQDPASVWQPRGEPAPPSRI
jgi:hypothetical protein